ncbi:MAG: DUF1684 domain-containing protein [Acidobacteria bacterium]|nr:DUF1684 domain-containing protein [Acidobacteriota bacterium]
MRWIALLASVFVVSSVAAQNAYVTEITQWRADHEKQLRSEDDWLTVAGLFWLKPGVNTVGSGGHYDVELTKSFPSGKFGEITLSEHGVVLALAPGVKALAGDVPVSAMTGEQVLPPIELKPDDPGPPTKIKVGSQSFYVIKRGDKLGIRLKDNKNPARLNFKGEKWYAIDPRFKVTATLEAYPEPKPVKVPNVLGGEFDYKSPGILRFTIDGKQLSLMPVIEDDHLFIIFRDPTSKTTTYGAGRFLYAPMPKDGKVELDFNKAENPPCAFTEFATCPLPPQGNRLDVAVPAGEKRNH